MTSTGVLVLLAIIPTVIILGFIYYKDKVEKEPIGLLFGLFFLGVVSTFAAAYSEHFLMKALSSSMQEDTVAFNFITYFFIVALSEEGVKFLILRTVTWKNKNFNYTFDAIVYAVVISLGFATLENILYVTDNGTLEVALLRAVLSVPGHAIDAVFMGLFFGRAKYCQCCGNNSGKTKNMLLSFFVPLLTHGFYDFCISLQKEFEWAMTLFLSYVVIITIVAIVYIHKSSKTDAALPGMGVPFWQYPNYPYNYYAQQQYQQQQYLQQQYQQQQYQQQQYQQQQYQQQQYQQQYQQQGYYTPNGYTQPTAPQQGYQQNGFVRQGQFYDPSGYPQQGQYQSNGNNNFNGQ